MITLFQRCSSDLCRNFKYACVLIVMGFAPVLHAQKSPQVKANFDDSIELTFFVEGTEGPRFESMSFRKGLEYLPYLTRLSKRYVKVSPNNEVFVQVALGTVGKGDSLIPIDSSQLSLMKAFFGTQVRVKRDVDLDVLKNFVVDQVNKDIRIQKLHDDLSKNQKKISWGYDTKFKLGPRERHLQLLEFLKVLNDHPGIHPKIKWVTISNNSDSIVQFEISLLYNEWGFNINVNDLKVIHDIEMNQLAPDIGLPSVQATIHAMSSEPNRTHWIKPAIQTRLDSLNTRSARSRFPEIKIETVAGFDKSIEIIKVLEQVNPQDLIPTIKEITISDTNQFSTEGLTLDGTRSSKLTREDLKYTLKHGRLPDKLIDQK